MRKICLLSSALLIAFVGLAQKPVSWNYSAKKISDKTYEIHLSATIQDGWHLYAQSQSENFIGTATSIRFTKHPLVFFAGKPTEVGALEIKREPSLGVESREYKESVDFVQRITLKGEIKTNVSGSIEFQVCTDEMCLQPTIVRFSVPLN